ncbi:MAG: acyl-ACP--UDP-N-acetylglucosamine O-acyltransferase [Pyramidobacter sp.]|nr:acyl-ACP--UDP-N-acetylglucosamine O-acyltransferase [Pyramidobacter sp.]
MGVHIHPSAVVSPKAELADGVVIGPYCIVDDKVIIGHDTVLRPFVHLCDYTTVGCESTVFENAILGPEPQDHGFKGEISYVTIGDRTVIRENVTIHRASGEGNVTSVGNDCLIMEGVHLGHNVQISDSVTISSKSGLAGYVKVGRGTVIGGLSGFHQFVRIGSYCMIGGASRVAQDVPPFMLVNGSPCRVYGLNVIGLRRNNFTAEQRQEIKSVYKKLYRSGQTLRNAVEALEGESGSDPLVSEIVEFFKNGDKHRGFCPWPRSTSLKSEN